MKSKLVFELLLMTIFLFPGCYTVLLVDDSTETATIVSTQVSQPPVEYVPIYCPHPFDPLPQPHPIYNPLPATHVPDSPSSTSTGSEDRREIQTGRGPANSNPEPSGNNENTTRDSGAQRGRR